MSKILIIDDYEEIRHLYGALLIKNGHVVETAENAESALIKILEGGYDLILLDLQMPNKDGLWLLEQLKTNVPQKPNGKIVIMSFIDDQITQDMVKKALENGAKDFLDKKISIGDELSKKIEQLLIKK